MPWGEQKYNHDTKHFYLDIKGYECRMSPTLEYETRFGGSVTDRCTCYIASLDFNFLERVSAWIKEHYPDGQISGTFSRETIRAVEYVSNGRYRLSISCAQNKAGLAAKAALFNAFFDENGRRFDMDAETEKAKILRDIEQGKAAAHKDAAATDKETKTMLIYRDPATGWLYRVSPQPEHGSYVMQYRDPANSATWKWCANWNIGNIYRESLEEVLETRAKRDGWELVSGPASSEPPEVVDKGEEHSPCDTCRCPDCIDSSCPQAGCDKTDGGFGCFAPYEECPAPAEETCPDERLEKEVGKCKNQSAPNGDAAATTSGSAAPEAAETSTTPMDANTLPAPGYPADAGSATQSLSAAGPASLEAEPEATPFDYSGLDTQTVDQLVDITGEFQRHRNNSMREYIQACIAVSNAHELLAAHYGGKWGEWCKSQGLSEGSARNMLNIGRAVLGSATVAELSESGEIGKRLLQLISDPKAPTALVEKVEKREITTAAQFQREREELEAQLKAEREAREKAAAEAESLRYANDALRDEAATARAQAKHAQEKADALETRPVMSELFDAKERIKELEARPVEVAVQEPDPAEVERRAGEKAREMTSMLQAQVRGMQEDLDDARKIIDSAESATYMAAAEFAANATQVLNGIRASFWAVAKELSDDDFSSAAAPLLEAARRIWDCEWDDDEEEQE